MQMGRAGAYLEPRPHRGLEQVLMGTPLCWAQASTLKREVSWRYIGSSQLPTTLKVFCQWKLLPTLYLSADAATKPQCCAMAGWVLI